MQDILPFASSLPLAVLQTALADDLSNGLGGTAGPDLTRYFLVCTLLLVGVVGLAWGFRRLIGRSLASRAAQRSLQVMDVLPMGGKHKLAVVRCYDRTFLMGLGEKELSLVAELDPVIAPESEPLPQEVDRHEFAELLARSPAGAPEPQGTRAAPTRTLAPEGVLG